MTDSPPFLHARDNKLQLLRRIGLFANLLPRELQLIADYTRLVEFKKNEVIYSEGATAKVFYVVVSGRLRITANHAAGESTLAYLHRGDSFGESALLTGEAHSATVTARNDTLVLTLTKNDFEMIIDRVPSLVLYLSRVLSRRLRRRDGRPSEFGESTIIAVHGAIPEHGRTSFAINLALSLQHETRHSSVIVDMSLRGNDVASILGLPESQPLLTRTTERIADPSVVQSAIQKHALGLHVLSVGHRDDTRSANLIAPLFTGLTDDFRFIIVDLPTELSESVLQALVQSDHIFLITNTKRESLLRTRALHKRLDDAIQQVDEKVHLVMNFQQHNTLSDGIADQERTLASSVKHILPFPVMSDPITPQGLIQLVQCDDAPYTQAIRRVARDVGKVLVGLALGSGAALGLAHIGILRVLERQRIPVDIISGSSIGALIAAFWATGKCADELEELATQYRTKGQMALHLLDVPTLPWRGMFPGLGITRYLRSVLHDTSFEDTRIPLRVVASNPFTREKVVFRQGSIVDAVRASVSIPGIFLPVNRQGNVLLDGGVSSPVPVGVLRQEGAQRIIAVNVFPTADEMMALDAAARRAKAARAEVIAMRTFPIRLCHWLREQAADIASPMVHHVIMRSMQMMEYQIGEIECQDADVVIRPSTPGATWDQFYQASRFIRRGEEAAEASLPQLAQLLDL